MHVGGRYPKAGTILPNDLAVIRVTFSADCIAEVFEEDVPCTVRLTQVQPPSRRSSLTSPCFHIACMRLHCLLAYPPRLPSLLTLLA